MVTAHPSAFGSLLKRYRLAAQLTQEELAEKARLSARAVSDLERGVRRAPYRDTVQQLADALELGDGERRELEHAVRQGRSLASAEEAPAGEDPIISAAPLGPAHAFSPVVTVGGQTTNLPLQSTPFIGREHELGEITACLRDSLVRLMTLTGPGGTGKTRLALEVGTALLDDYADGVFFVNLAPLADPTLVPFAIAEIFGVKEEPERELLTSLIDALRTKHLLLVLDNFEHLLAASSVVLSLLDGCRQLHVLVTSRIPLHLSWEHEHYVPPLTVPQPQHLPSLEHLTQYGAVALFIERARAARDSFTVTNENAPAVAQICYQLDGLPLAIELAAARIKLFPPQTLLPRLSNSLQILTGGARDKPSRQQTLRGAIDWSYSLLSLEEQMLFARLSVFAGGCTFEAADSVCNPDRQLDVLEGLSSLVDKSLVRQEREDEPRLVMLETIREYAAGKLDDKGEGERMRRAHTEYLVTLAEKAGIEQKGTVSADSLNRLDAELSNLRAALQWARDGGDGNLGLRLAVAMTDFWEKRGYFTEGRRWLQDLLPATEDTAPAVQAHGLRAATRLAAAQHDWPSARDWGQKSLAVFYDLGDQREIADMLNYVGVALMGLGEFAEATRTLEEGLVLARAFPDRKLLSHILATFAWARALEGDLDQASDLGEESLELSRAADDVPCMTMALDPLLYIARLRGEIQRARRVFAEYADLLQRSDFYMDRTARDAIERLAMGARSWGDYAASRGVLERAMSLSLEAGNGHTAAHIQIILALVERERGQYERAIALLEESLAAFRTSDDPYGIARAILGLADVARDRGDGGATMKFAQESLALNRTLGDKFHVGWSLNNLAMGAFQQGDHDRADGLLQEALLLMLEGDGRAEILTNRGLVAVAREEYAQAKEYFANALYFGRAGNMAWLTATDLEGMAMVSAGLGQAERAARLFGAADAGHRTIGTPVLPAIRPLYDRYVAEARNVLGEARFDAAWQEGEALSFEDALALALG